MRYVLGLFIILTAFWGLNSPNDSLLLIVMGLMSVLLVVYLTLRMRLLDKESFPLHLMIRILPFYLWLTKEIFIGSLYVLKQILFHASRLEPRVVTFALPFKQALTQVIFANSVTLVPGTLSMKLEDGQLTVHALTAELAESLLEGELTRRVARLES